MQQEQLKKLKEFAKDESAFKQLESLFKQVYGEKDLFKSYLTLLEKAISNDYDSIIITELSLESPGPKIVYVNDGFTKLTGFTKEEAIGKTPRILQGPKTDRQTLDRLKHCLIEGKSFFGQAVNYRKDRSEFINQWDIHPLYDDNGTITHWVSYQHDITKRKSAEATFNETEVEFDNLIEYSKRTLIDIDLKGNIIKANKAFRTLTGFDNGELTDHSFASIIDKHDTSILNDLLKNPSSSNKRTFTISTKNNIPIQVEIENEIHTIENGDLIRLTVHNVSMQKQVLKTLEERLFSDTTISKKSEFNYELVFDATKKPQFTYLSDGFESITGFKKTDFLHADSWSKLIPSKDQEKALKHLNEVVNGLDMVEELHINHASGKTISILNYAQLDISENENGVYRITGSIVKADQNQMA